MYDLQEYDLNSEKTENSTERQHEPRFQLGRVYMTRGIADRIAEDRRFAQFVASSLARHARGDWGDLCAEDKKENEFSLRKFLRLFSAYNIPGDAKPGDDNRIWIITEANRTATTILFPSEY